MGRVRESEAWGLHLPQGHRTGTYQTWPERGIHAAGQEIIPIDVPEEGVPLRVESILKHANCSPFLAPSPPSGPRLTCTSAASPRPPPIRWLGFRFKNCGTEAEGRAWGRYYHLAWGGWGKTRLGGAL